MSQRDKPPAGSVTSTLNGADGVSDIEGKAAREAASECGQRVSFNGALGRLVKPYLLSSSVF